jgi:hypothetical protein
MSPARRQLVATLIPIAIALASLAISAFTSYAGNDKQLTGRIITVEERQGADRETLREIKVKVDKIYDKVAGW